MRKIGKYERKPEPAKEKQPKVKNVLLQTYLTSLLSMVLCVTMFLGTSYAWFTSEVNNTNNEIYIGILDAELEKQVDAEWVSLSATENGVNKYHLFDGSVRWEPGYTSLETVKVTNMGDLAFNYTLSFTDGTVSDKAGTALEETKLEQIAHHFDVWVYDHEVNGVPTATSYEHIIAPDTKWVKAGTLAEILAGESVLEGTLKTVRNGDLAEGTTLPNNGTADGVLASDTYTIALHMNEGADSSVMGHKISLNVKLVAYQLNHEQDDFGSADYDDVNLVSTIEQLQKAVDEATGEEIFVLGEDITGDLTVTQKPDVKITIDGNGHYFNGTITVDGKSTRYETAALTIQNIQFASVSGDDTVYINLGQNNNSATRYTDNVTVRDCSFISVGNTTVAIKSYTGGDHNLTIDGCSVDAGMHSLLQVTNVETGLRIMDCTVNSKNGINLNNTPSLEMSGCTFDVTGYAIRIGDTSEGTADAKSYTVTDCTLKSACAAADDAVIVIRTSAQNATVTLVKTIVEGTNQLIQQASSATVNGLPS